MGRMVIFIAIITASAALAQTDSLMLSEISNIQAPANITGFYAADLQGDSTKELIISSITNLYVYNSQTGALLWTSPEMHNPRDVTFYDLDGDSHPDIAVRDSLNLFVFSGFDFHLLWMFSIR